MYICAHLGDKTLSHVPMPSATPTHPSQQHGAHICRCLAASVRVYAKHTHTHTESGTQYSKMQFTGSLSRCRPTFARNNTSMQLLAHSWANAQLACSLRGMWLFGSKGALRGKRPCPQSWCQFMPLLGQLVADEEERAPMCLFPLCHFLQGPWHMGYCLCLSFLAYIREVTLLLEVMSCEELNRSV